MQEIPDFERDAMGNDGTHNSPRPDYLDGKSLPVSLGSIPEPPPYEGLLGGLIAKGFPSILYGDGGQGKSYLALGLATGVASGLGFGGLPLPQGSALYVDWELSLEEQLRRAHNIARGLGLAKPPDGLKYWAPQASLLRISDKLGRFVDRNRVVLVVLDSFGPGCGVNPESAEDIIGVFEPIRALGASVLLIDHQAKLQEGQEYKRRTPFGSVFKTNLARSVLQLEKRNASKGQFTSLVRQTKNNLGPIVPGLTITSVFEDNSVRFEAESVEDDLASTAEKGLDERIIEALQPQTATLEWLSANLQENEKTIGNRLPILERGRRVVRAGKSGKKQLWGLPGNSPPNLPLREEVGGKLEPGISQNPQEGR